MAGSGEEEEVERGEEELLGVPSRGNATQRDSGDTVGVVGGRTKRRQVVAAAGSQKLLKQDQHRLATLRDGDTRTRRTVFWPPETESSLHTRKRRNLCWW